jgi:hypothetical protein
MAAANRFAGFADNGGVPEGGFSPAVARTAKPKNPTRAKARTAKPVAIDDEDGFIPEAKKGTTMVDYDISRGPYHAILDKMARARQARRARFAHMRHGVPVFCSQANLKDT